MALAEFFFDWHWKVNGAAVENPLFQGPAFLGILILLCTLLIGLGFLFLAVGSLAGLVVFGVFSSIGILLLATALPFLIPLLVIPVFIFLTVLFMKKKKDLANRGSKDSRNEAAGGVR